MDKFARIMAIIGICLSSVSLFFSYRPFSLMGEQLLFSDAGFDFPEVHIDQNGLLHVHAKVYVTNSSTIDEAVIRTYCYNPYRIKGEYGYQTNCSINFDSSIPYSIKAGSSVVMIVDTTLPIGEKAKKTLVDFANIKPDPSLEEMSGALARSGFDLYDRRSGDSGYGFGQQPTSVLDMFSKEDFDPSFVVELTTARGNAFKSGRFSLSMGVGGF